MLTKDFLTAQDRYIQAEKQDAELLFEIYNSAFYDDYLRYEHCQAYGRTKEEMEKSIEAYPKIIAYYKNNAALYV